MLEAFVDSDLGYQTWQAHYELDVKIAENQSEWTPLQRNFLFMAGDKYGPDNPETNQSINGRSARQFDY